MHFPHHNVRIHVRHLTNRTAYYYMTSMIVSVPIDRRQQQQIAPTTDPVTHSQINALRLCVMHTRENEIFISPQCLYALINLKYHKPKYSSKSFEMESASSSPSASITLAVSIK